MTSEAVMDVELRGAPLALLRRLRRFDGEGKVMEILVEGPAGTGKSRGVGHVLYWMAHEWPGIRVLLVRKTRKSLNESFLQTWEDEVVPFGHPMLAGAKREHRDSYDVGNGSVFITGGLDNPQRLYSTQFDVVYIQEISELTLDEYEKFFRAMRGRRGGIPFKLIVADNNPGDPNDWVSERWPLESPDLLLSRHRDNPMLWDKEAKDYSREGRTYMDGLDKLSGVRRLRLRDGKRVTVEGAVWETYDATIHLIDRPHDLKRDLGITRFVGAVDWGHSDPGVLQVWGLDADDRAYLVAEWYATQKDQAWWAERVAEACAEFQPMKAIVCDPADSQGGKAAMNLRLARAGHRPVAIPADNARHSQGQGDLVGLDLVRERLKVDPKTGKAWIYILRDSSRYRDEWLEQNKRPTSLAREIPGYVYLVDESGKPSKERTDPTCPDHACDPTRYMANFVWRHSMQNPEPELKPKLGSIAAQLSVRNPQAAREWLEQDAYNRRKAKESVKSG